MVDLPIWVPVFYCLVLLQEDHACWRCSGSVRHCEGRFGEGEREPVIVDDREIRRSRGGFVQAFSICRAKGRKTNFPLSLGPDATCFALYRLRGDL